MVKCYSNECFDPSLSFAAKKVPGVEVLREVWWDYHQIIAMRYLFGLIFAITVTLATVDANSPPCSPGYYANWTQCAPCPENSYSQAGWSTCYNHTDCRVKYRRMVLVAGSSSKNIKCGNCLLHFVDDEGVDGDDSFVTACIPCEGASQETRDKYPWDWCHAMVTAELNQQSQSLLRTSQDEVSLYQSAFYTTLVVSLALMITLIVGFVCYIKRLQGCKHPSQAAHNGSGAQKVV